MKLFFALCLLFGVVVCKTNWALIVAGSNEYYNYRHQADVSHAYMLFKAKGFDDAHIVSMMYDDIANNAQNPFKGNIINHVGGPNVYPGSAKIDYKGNDVTAKNFLSILTGNAAAMKGIGSGKVVASGPDDNVFIFYSDHGAPGIVAMPTGDYLHATDLNAAIKEMFTQKKYHEMIFYIEACESGSMFADLLPTNLNVYATTASNPTESSWACYYDASRGAYLGDTYSVNFLEDSDAADMNTETLQVQFQNIKLKTDQSHVMQYGNLQMAAEPLKNFLVFGKFSHPHKCPVSSLGKQVDQRDAKLATLMNQLQSNKNDETLMVKIDEELAHRTKMDRLFTRLSQNVVGHTKFATTPVHSVNDATCLKYAIKAYESVCGRFSDYGLRYVNTLAHLCNEGVSHSRIHEEVTRLC